MGIKRDILEFYTSATKLPLFLLSKDRRELASSIIAWETAPVITRETKYGPIKFFCFDKLPAWRAQTLLIKEPETIEWIDGFEADAVLWDIGANVGCYSLYAAKKGAQVYAFEPCASNYYLLCQNIAINKLVDKISAFCLAFAKETQLGFLNMSTVEPGGALAGFGKKQEKIKVEEIEREVVSRQGMMGFSIDDFIRQYNPVFPTYIKIDVDGIEDEIVAGAIKTLSDKRIKSALIELNDHEVQYRDNVIKMVESCGLQLVDKKHSDRFNAGEYAGFYNFIFKRK
jgi:FkbM family methyltransferase